MSRSRHLLLTTLLILSLAAVIAPGAGASGAGGAPAAPAVDAARGLRFDGLVAAGPDSRCEQGYAFAAPGLAEYCTHGPDAAPAGVDVRVAQTAPMSAEQVAAAGDLVCDGDGTSGFRAEAIYVNLQGNASRYATYADSFRAWAASIQQEVAASTLEHDPSADPLYYRFVHTPTAADGTCDLVVHQVTLSQSADDSFSNTINELKALGFNAKDRNYLIWMDANRLCGIGTIYGDTRPDPSQNYNNIGYAASYSRADAGCWNYAETHELMHNIGAVQNNAPNSSGGYHCNDDRDIMCYSDGGSKSALFISPSCSDGRFESLLDCNGDDYFNPSPAAGTYLASNWNTADSAWLFSRPSGVTDPDPTPSAPVANADTAAVDEGRSVTIDVLANDTDADGDIAASTLRVATPPAVGTATVSAGKLVYDATAVSGPATASLTYQVCDATGLCGSADVTVTVQDVADPGVVTETFTGSLNKKTPSLSFGFTTGAVGDIVVRFDDGTTATAGAPPEGKGGGSGKAGGGGGGKSSPFTVELLDGSTVVMSQRGTGVLTFTATDEAAGNYTVRVRDGKGSFTLDVEHR